MSSELDTLILQSLAEGEKCCAEIYYWIKARPGGADLLVPLALPSALDALETAGLIERYTIRKIPQFPEAKPQWSYRLTADGALTQWTGEFSIPQEKSPA